MSSRPLIAMIHNNRPDLTDLAICSLRAYTSALYRLLLINNASPDDLGCLNPDELVVNQLPYIFVHNCNLALERARGERVRLDARGDRHDVCGRWQELGPRCWSTST